jgi:hypothetical protein
LNESSQLRRAMLPLYAPGGIVFGVVFGEVSNGVVTDHIECTRATPVTYSSWPKGRAR